MMGWMVVTAAAHPRRSSPRFARERMRQLSRNSCLPRGARSKNQELVLWSDWRVSMADRYGLENPAQRQKTRRIKYGVPGTLLYPLVFC